MGLFDNAFVGNMKQLDRKRSLSNKSPKERMVEAFEDQLGIISGNAKLVAGNEKKSWLENGMVTIKVSDITLGSNIACSESEYGDFLKNCISMINDGKMDDAVKTLEESLEKKKRNKGLRKRRNELLDLRDKDAGLTSAQNEELVSIIKEVGNKPKRKSK